MLASNVYDGAILHLGICESEEGLDAEEPESEGEGDVEENLYTVGGRMGAQEREDGSMIWNFPNSELFPDTYRETGMSWPEQRHWESFAS